MIGLVKSFRDWSLITGRRGLQNADPIPPHPPQDDDIFRAHPFKEWKLFVPPPHFNMAKTSSYSIKTTPKLFVPPFSMVKTLFDPPFRRSKT